MEEHHDRKKLSLLAKTKTKVVEVSHTRCCALGKNTLLCGTNAEEAARHGITYARIYQVIQTEVSAVSEACINGSKFLNFWIQMLLAGKGIPQNFPWLRAVTQAFAAMKTVSRPHTKAPGLDEALILWRNYTPDLPLAAVLTNNALTSESNTYYHTLLSNYTTVTLSSHVMRALQYLHPEHFVLLRSMLRFGNKSADRTVLPAEALSTIDECLDIMMEYNDVNLTRATVLRWNLLEQMTAQSKLPVRLRKNRKGEDIPIEPKWFSLLPYAAKAARFIRIDENVARRMMGLRETKPSSHVPDERERVLTLVSALHTLCGDSKFVRSMSKPVRHNGGAVLTFPKSVTTNGVALHISFIEYRVVRADIPSAWVTQNLARHKDRRSNDADELRAQLGEPSDATRHRHGLFTLDSAAGLDSTLHCTNAVGVDPGVRYLLYTSTDAKLTRDDYYGSVPKESVYDDTKVTKGSHTHYTRRKKLPKTIFDKVQELSDKPLRGAIGTFEANLKVWATHSKALREYYGSRSWRSGTFDRSNKKRRVLDTVVQLVAPDPRTVVVFGANFNGRSCQYGDIAGPVCVKGLRRKLAQQRVVVMVDEFNTTKMHLTCGKELSSSSLDAHEKVCNHCGGVNVKRDLNAAQNILKVWTQFLSDGTRPIHLSRVTTMAV
jgi:hypothetical protein